MRLRWILAGGLLQAIAGCATDRGVRTLVFEPAETQAAIEVDAKRHRLGQGGFSLAFYDTVDVTELPLRRLVNVAPR